MIIKGVYIPDEMEKQIRIIFDSLKKRNIPEGLREQFEDWLLDETNKELKKDGLSEIFDKTFDYEENPRERSYELFLEFIKRNGLTELYDETLHAEAGDETNAADAETAGDEPAPVVELKRPRNRSILLRIAAVLIPALIIGGSLAWYFSGTTTDPQVGPVQVAVTQPEKTEVGVEVPAEAEPQAVELADGSRVDVKPGSRITYPEDFLITREVWLEGEARFDVTPEPGTVFVVKTAHLTIRVLGTSFDVIANSAENVTRVILYQGSVEVSSVRDTMIMKAGEIVEYDHITYTLAQVKATEAKNDVPEDVIVTQVARMLVFDNATLPEIFTLLETFYGIDFQYDPALFDNARFKLPVSQDDDVQLVMAVLHTISEDSFDYTITRDAVVISNK